MAFFWFSEIRGIPFSAVQRKGSQRQRLHAAASYVPDRSDFDELVPIGKGGVIAANKSLSVLNRTIRDFDPLLSKGHPGNPGLKARVNSPTFKYFATLLAPIIDREIRQARIPPTIECIAKLNGCIQVYNVYISHYRCPQRLVIFPSPPNQVVVRIENLSIGIIGNIVGDLNVLIPIKLSGIIHVNAQQVSTTVKLAIVQSGVGPPFVQMIDCQVSVGYVDAYMEDGGIIGAIANGEFRHQMNHQIRAMIPKKVCQRIPEALNTRLNPKLTKIPQAVALLEMLQLINGALALGGGNNVCENQKICNPRKVARAIPPPFKWTSSSEAINERGSVTASASSLPIPQRPKNFIVLDGSTQRFHGKDKLFVPSKSRAFISATTGSVSASTFHKSNDTDCVEKPAPPNAFCRARKFIDKLDISQLKDISLTTHLIQTYATKSDYTIAINGEFSQFGRGGTPFGAFFMDFPSQKENKMIEILVSDYTINSLFYIMHR